MHIPRAIEAIIGFPQNFVYQIPRSTMMKIFKLVHFLRLASLAVDAEVDLFSAPK